MSGALIQTGKSFMGSGGRWASEQMLKALKEGRPFSTDELRTADTLRKDEWKAYDTALVREGVIRLRGVADLVGAGLVKTVANGFGKTVFEWETVTDMDEASVSMDGISRTDNDRQEFDLEGIPLPIIHKDFCLHMRHLAASRERGEPLDTMQAGTAGRVVSEMVEQILFQGTTKKFRGLSLYGYTTHPNRNTSAFGTGGAWTGAKTGDQILTDVLTMIAGLEADRFYGPYWLYVGSSSSTKLEEDFKANSDKTIRQRLLEVDRLQRVTVADKMPAGEVVMVQPTMDVVSMVEGAPLQSIQWDVEGGMRVNFKAMTINVPLIRADVDGRSGVFHMS